MYDEIMEGSCIILGYILIILVVSFLSEKNEAYFMWVLNFLYLTYKLTFALEKFCRSMESFVNNYKHL